MNGILIKLYTVNFTVFINDWTNERTNRQKNSFRVFLLSGYSSIKYTTFLFDWAHAESILRPREYQNNIFNWIVHFILLIYTIIHINTLNFSTLRNRRTISLNLNCTWISLVCIYFSLLLLFGIEFELQVCCSFHSRYFRR